MTDNYHQEWLERKAKRVAKQAQNATLIREYKHAGTGRIMKVLKAQRSKGFRSNYQPVTTFFLLVYDGVKLIHGATKTARQWQKEEAEFAKVCACQEYIARGI